MIAWILPFFYRDFLRLENRIPYSVLELLFDMSMVFTKDLERSLTDLAFCPEKLGCNKTLTSPN